MRYFKDESLNSLANELEEFAALHGCNKRTLFVKGLDRNTIINICNELPRTVAELRAGKTPLSPKIIDTHGKSIVYIVNKWSRATKPMPFIPRGAVSSTVTKLQNRRVMTIEQNGFFYNVSGNDALILNKHFGYKLYGTDTPRTGFPVSKSKKIFKKLDKLGIDYDVFDKNKDIVSVKRFAKNRYENVTAADGSNKKVKRTGLPSGRKTSANKTIIKRGK